MPKALPKALHSQIRAQRPPPGHRGRRHPAAQGAAPGEALAGAAARHAPQQDEYEFLIKDGFIDRETLNMAEATAWYWGVSCPAALVALGWLSAERYLTALGGILGLMVIENEIRLAPLAGSAGTGDSASIPGGFPAPCPGMLRLVHEGGDGAPFFALDGLALPPSEIRRVLALSGLGPGEVVLVPPRILRNGYEKAMAGQLSGRAVDGLRLATPEFSAGTRICSWQILMVVALAGLCLGGLIVAPALSVAALGGLLAIPFLFVVLLRVFALAEGLFRRRAFTSVSDGPRTGADQLPPYSILVPLYDEAEILPDLIDALRSLDYPAARLEIMLILESVDHATQLAAAALDLPPQFRIVVVPDTNPRTKPKALNYALQLARGDFVVVYDAEDMPEPDQLRRAVARFAGGAKDLACLQARLNIYNPFDNLLTRQFSIEYSALFDALLPAFQRLGIPIPLGGTSNHFPRRVLDGLGGWDPYNVTEDADLGIRLTRAGLRTEILHSTTYEEAPSRLRLWTRQRSRWLKGWMQTYLVHSRQPARLLRDLGLWRCMGLHVLMGGILLSALVHPLFYVVALTHLAFGEFLSSPAAGLTWLLWWIAGVNLALGYVSSMALGALTVIARGQWSLVPHVLAMPLYWLLISFAAYRALWQLATDPYKWEKTAHTRRHRASGQSRAHL